jgi:RNA polymerase sigma-70 factor, ECF subfamily
MLSLNPTLVSVTSPEPRELLAQALAGDAEAFGELCREYETRLVRQAMTLCADPALAEELAQDTLVEAWKCLRRYNGRCQFFTWLCAILLNRYRNTVRRSRLLRLSALWLHGSEEDGRALSEVPAPGSLPDETAQQHDEAALLRKCVAALPAKHQQVIHLRFYVDDSVEGIAAALGCSVGTVKSRLFHALDKLRAMHALRDREAGVRPSLDTAVAGVRRGWKDEGLPLGEAAAPEDGRAPKPSRAAPPDD